MSISVNEPTPQILFIDDEAEIRTVVEQLFRLEGLHCSTTANPGVTPRVFRAAARCATSVRSWRERALPSISWAVMVGAGVMITSGIIFVCSRLARGQASFSDLILLMSWFQFLQLALYIAQMVLVVLLPPLGVLVALASVGLTLWVLAHFIKTANGFASLVGPFLGIFGVLALLVLLLLSGA